MYYCRKLLQERTVKLTLHKVSSLSLIIITIYGERKHVKYIGQVVTEKNMFMIDDSQVCVISNQGAWTKLVLRKVKISPTKFLRRIILNLVFINERWLHGSHIEISILRSCTNLNLLSVNKHSDKISPESIKSFLSSQICKMFMDANNLQWHKLT